MASPSTPRDRAYRVAQRFFRDLVTEALGGEWHPKYEFRVTEFVGAIIHAAVEEAQQNVQEEQG